MKNNIVSIIVTTSAKLPLRTVLTVPFIIQIVVAVGLTGYLSFRNGQRAVNDLATELKHQILERVEDKLTTYLATPRQINQSNAAAIQLGELNVENLKAWEQHFIKQIQIFDSVNSIVIGNEKRGFVGVEVRQNPSRVVMFSDESTGYILETYAVNEQGQRLQRVTATPNYDPRIRPWYKAPVEAKKPTWSNIFTQFDTKDLTLAAVDPVYDRQGNLQGVVNSSLHLVKVGNFLNKLKIGKTGQGFIMERDGMLVATSTTEKLARFHKGKLERIPAIESENNLIQETAKYLLKQTQELKKITTSLSFQFKIDGKVQFLEALPFQDGNGLDWIVVVVIPESDFMEQINENTRTTILLCLSALIVATVLGIFTARWVTKPILYLNAAAKAIARGEWTQNIEFKRSDELGQLAKSFNSMAGQLQEYFATLEAKNVEMNSLNEALSESERTLSQLLEAMPVGVFVVDARGKPFYVNYRAQELLGQGIVSNEANQPLREVYQAYLAGTQELYPEERDPILCALQGESVNIEDIEIYQSERIVPIEVWATPIYGEQGNITYAIAAFTDISQRKQAEKILAEYNQTLEMQVRSRTQELSQTLEHLKATQQELIQSEKMAALGQLIAGVAHEINTPLGAIRSSVENIADFWQNNLLQLPEFLKNLSAERYSDFLTLLSKSNQLEECLSSKEKRKLRKNLVSKLKEQAIANSEMIADTLVDLGIYDDLTPFLPLLQDPDRLTILRLTYQLSSLQKSTFTIQTATDRASKVVYALKSYARYDSFGEKVFANITEGIDTILTLYHNKLKQGVEVIRNYESELPLVLCYPDELNQVWTNLIHNALQAMDNKGKLNINVNREEENLRVSFTDSGQGIPPEIMPRIFEPFFTTKPPGEGSGLGLDIVNKILAKHQAKIEVKSTCGQTTFTVFLPTAIK